MAKQPSAKVVSSRHQRERYLQAGLVQINAWIPADKAREILEDCARLRVEHLRHVEYWRMLEQKEAAACTIPSGPAATVAE